MRVWDEKRIKSNVRKKILYIIVYFIAFFYVLSKVSTAIEIYICIGIIVILILIFVKKRYKYKTSIVLKYRNNEFEELYSILKQEYGKKLKEKKRIYITLYFFIYFFIYINIFNIYIEDIFNIYLIAYFVFPLPIFYIISNELNPLAEVNTYKKYYKEKIILSLVNKIFKNNSADMLNKTQKMDVSKFFVEIQYKYNDVTRFDIESDYLKTNLNNKLDEIEIYIDDIIEGNLDENNYIKMADIRVNELTKNRRKVIKEEFNGLFVVLQCSKYLNPYILIKGKGLKYIQDDYIDMDSEDFNKYFNVFTDDKILTMRLLTPDIMEMLVEYREKYNLHFEIALRDNKIYIRFFTGDLFEPSIFGDPMNKELLITYYCVLQFSLELTKKVNKVLEDLEV